MKPLGQRHLVAAIIIVAMMLVAGMELFRYHRTAKTYPGLKMFRVYDVDSIQSLAFSPDGKRLAFATASLIGAMDPISCDVKQDRDQSSEVYEVSSTRYSSEKKGGVYVFNLVEGRTVAGGAVLKGWANALAFTPDGRTLLVAEGDVGGNQRGHQIDSALEPVANGPGKLVLLDTKTWRSRSIEFAGPVLSVAISPDGKTAAALALTASRTPKTEVTLWDLADGVKTGEFALDGAVLVPALAGPLQLLAFSPDGTKLAVVDRRRLRTDTELVWDAAKQAAHYRWEVDAGDVVIWDVAKRAVVHTIRQSAAAASFTPDGRHLVVSGEGTSVYDTDTWTSSYVMGRHDWLTTTLLEPLCYEHRLFLAPDGSVDGSVRCSVLQLPDGEPQWVGRFVSPFRRKNLWRADAVAVSPDRRLIAAGGDGRDICVWAMPEFPQCKHERGEAKKGP